MNIVRGPKRNISIARKANGKPFVYGANGPGPMERRRNQIAKGMIRADRWDGSKWVTA